MNKLLLALALLSLSGTAFAGAPGVLYAEPEEGLFVVRNPQLAEALKASDRVCAQYAASQEDADLAAKDAAAAPAKRTLQRVKANKLEAARKLMAECLESDRVAKKTVSEVLGPKALKRLQKAAPFEDMVLVQLMPTSADHFEALK